MTIPIAHIPMMAQVEQLRPFVEGRSCVVVGSAPIETRTAEIGPDEVSVAVNGGIASLPGSADVWVLNSKLQDRPGDPNLKPLHKAMVQQGRDRSVGHLLLLRGPKVASEAFTLETLDRLGCRYQSWSVLDKVTKRKFEGVHCGRSQENRPCSAGILTVAMALVCGAAHVRMVGFSFAPGYHYLPTVKPEYWWRDHIHADRRALSILSSAYRSRLSGSILEAVAA